MGQTATFLLNLFRIYGGIDVALEITYVILTYWLKMIAIIQDIFSNQLLKGIMRSVVPIPASLK